VKAPRNFKPDRRASPPGPLVPARRKSCCNVDREKRSAYQESRPCHGGKTMTGLYDLHTHTILSDGEMLPSELVRRMAVMGYTTVAITDHVDTSNAATV